MSDDNWWQPERVRVGRGKQGAGAHERACAVGRFLVRRGLWTNPDETLLTVHEVYDVYLAVMLYAMRNLGEFPVTAGVDYEIVEDGRYIQMVLLDVNE